jgi:hypothetical protein
MVQETHYKKYLLEADIQSARLRGNFALVALLATKYNKKYSTILDVIASIECTHLHSITTESISRAWDCVTPDKIIDFISVEETGDEIETAIGKLAAARKTLDYTLGFQANLLSASLLYHAGNVSRACEFAGTLYFLIVRYFDYGL